jgi:hypothetical protein
MHASPMRPAHNAAALVATLLAAGALLPLPGRVRLLCVALACAAIVLLLVARLRAHGARRTDARVDGVYGRIERIRRAREKRRRGG